MPERHPRLMCQDACETLREATGSASLCDLCNQTVDDICDASRPGFSGYDCHQLGATAPVCHVVIPYTDCAMYSCAWACYYILLL